MITSSLRKWLIVGVLHLTIAVAGTVATAKGVFFPSLIDTFGLSHAAAGALLSSSVIVSGLLALLVGLVLARRVRIEILIAGATALIGVAYLLASFATSYSQLLIAYMLMAGGGVHLVAAPYLLTGWFGKHRTVALAAVLSGTTTGGVLLTPLLTWLVDIYDWRATYRLLALVLAVILPLALLVIVRPGPITVETSDPLARGDKTLRQGLRTSGFWLLLGGYAIFIANTNIYFTHFIAAMKSMFATPGQAAWLMSLLFTLAACAKFIFGYLADRFSVKTMLGAAFALSAVGLLLLLPQHNPVAFAGFIVFYGLSYSAPLVLFPILVSEVFGRRNFPQIDAAITVIGKTVGAAGPILAGWIFDRSGSYHAVFLATGLLLFAGAGMIWMIGGTLRFGKARLGRSGPPLVVPED